MDSQRAACEQQHQRRGPCSHGNQFTYGNEYADLLTGNLNSYNETNFNRLNDIYYYTFEFFGQDSWKATRKLTLEFGLRFTHFTPWIDGKNFGYSIFDQSQYQTGCADAPTFCGFVWHAKNSSVPLGGFPTRKLFYQPRFGAAYDLFGTGKTVLRGGWGRFYYHSGQFTNGLDASAGVASASRKPDHLGWRPRLSHQSCKWFAALFAAYLSCLNVAATPSAPSAVDSRDNKQPYTDSWSFTVAQRTPWQGLLEVAYVGNRSRDLPSSGGFGSNLNLVPAGCDVVHPIPPTLIPVLPALEQPEHGPRLRRSESGDQQPLRELQGDAGYLGPSFRPLYHSGELHPAKGYGHHQCQCQWPAEWVRQYQPFNLQSNYGVQPTDRRHLFNIAYSIDIGNPLHAHGFLSGVTSGWQISGITQIESGANITYSGGYNASTNYNMR